MTSAHWIAAVKNFFLSVTSAHWIVAVKIFFKLCLLTFLYICCCFHFCTCKSKKKFCIKVISCYTILYFYNRKFFPCPSWLYLLSANIMNATQIDILVSMWSVTNNSKCKQISFWKYSLQMKKFICNPSVTQNTTKKYFPTHTTFLFVVEYVLLGKHILSFNSRP